MKEGEEVLHINNKRPLLCKGLFYYSSMLRIILSLDYLLNYRFILNSFICSVLYCLLYFLCCMNENLDQQQAVIILKNLISKKN
jgi:dolichol kinase